jgi:hypothetical protein
MFRPWHSWTLVIVDLTKDIIEITNYDGFQTGPIADYEFKSGQQESS